jgi:hypothetical protein
VQIARVPGEGLEVLEAAPVLDDGGEPHPVGQQPLLRTRHEVLQHGLHPAPAAAEVHEALGGQPRLVQPGADQEDDEVAVDVGAEAPAVDLRHALLLGVEVPGRRRSSASTSSTSSPSTVVGQSPASSLRIAARASA